MSDSAKTGWGFISGGGFAAILILAVNTIFGAGKQSEALKTVQLDVAEIKHIQKEQTSQINALVQFVMPPKPHYREVGK